METVSHAQVKEASRAGTLGRIVVRTVTILLTALLIGLAVRHVLGKLDQGKGPAGFGRGVVQGALMPCAFPNLLVGNDVVIYARNNTGLPYKLGYTVGVNACGALFFGFFFWRLNRWRRQNNGKKDLRGHGQVS